MLQPENRGGPHQAGTYYLPVWCGCCAGLAAGWLQRSRCCPASRVGCRTAAVAARRLPVSAWAVPCAYGRMACVARAGGDWPPRSRCCALALTSVLVSADRGNTARPAWRLPISAGTAGCVCGQSWGCAEMSALPPRGALRASDGRAVWRCAAGSSCAMQLRCWPTWVYRRHCRCCGGALEDGAQAVVGCARSVACIEPVAALRCAGSA